MPRVASTRPKPQPGGSRTVSEAPLRIYVGTEDEQLLPFAVLGFTIRKHASVPVEILPLHQVIESRGFVVPTPAAVGNVAHTPFSFQRFAIPELNGYKGIAIYMDSDMVVFRDVAQLPAYLSADAQVAAAAEPADSGRKSQISVMVLNCAKLDWDVRRVVSDLDRGVFTYRQLYSNLPIASKFERSIPHVWNDLERHTPGTSALTHFTDMETQPWLTTESPLTTMWCSCLLEAIEAGAVTAARVHEEVARGWLRPSLAYQVDHRIADPAQLPPEILARDARQFTPPHRVGIISRGWARSFASRVTDYGSDTPGKPALLMRGAQAFAYRVYKRLRAKSLNARM